MANLHDTFIEFDKDIIKLSSTKKNELRTSRNAVRSDIEKYFDDNRPDHTVHFKGQGSFVMNTTILPISGEYDVDDGVYIFGKKEDRPTPQTAHNWIYDAVKDRTGQETIDKNTCVRVQYAKQYHIDLPIYYKIKSSEDEYTLDIDDVPLLAHKAKDWIPSDPYAFKKWFDDQSKAKPQLKRIVRYLKAWTDNKRDANDKLILPSGLVLTILACNNFHPNDRDDSSLLETLKHIQKAIDDRNNFFASYVCYRPTIEKNENLLDKYSSATTKNNFLEALGSFIISGSQAVEMKSKKDACAKWQKHLGDRFPCKNIVEAPEEIAKAFVYPDQIKSDNKSA
jgi:Second Messenger Oligonucleotide or Dinucleotide Synthetase domain